MEKALRVYGEVLRLVRRLPEDSQPYYSKYVRENFVNYREVDPGDAKAIEELFHRAYNHSIWVLSKYSVEESAANRLRLEISLILEECADFLVRAADRRIPSEYIWIPEVVVEFLLSEYLSRASTENELGGAASGL